MHLSMLVHRQLNGAFFSSMKIIEGEITSNSDVIRLGQAIGSVDEGQVKRAMIKKTIEEHLNKELVLNPQGIKVLSLFFIDSVA